MQAMPWLIVFVVVVCGCLGRPSVVTSVDGGFADIVVCLTFIDEVTIETGTAHDCR